MSLHDKRSYASLYIGTFLFIFFTTGFSFLSLQAAGQHRFELQGKVSGLTQKKVYLLRLYGTAKTLIDSAAVNETGEFIFIIPNEAGRNKEPVGDNDLKEGLYRVFLGQTAKAKFNDEAPQSFDIILSAGKTVLSTSFENPVENMKVTAGTENQHYYEYLAKKNGSTRKLQILENILRIYPDDCSSDSNKNGCFYKTAQNEYNQVQRELLAYTDGMIKKYPTAFFTKIARAEQYPFLDAALTADVRSETLKAHFFKPSDFQDTLLLRSNALTNKIIAYLGLYPNKQYTKEQQTAEFIKAVDRLMPLAKTGEAEVYKYILDYLVEGFNMIKQDEVLAYITDHYLAENSCGIEDENIKEILKKSADYKRTAIGVKTPEIVFNSPILTPDPLFVIKTLSDIHSNYTLILFWASWCPHCTKMLPELKNIYDAYKDKGLQILAISLDTDSTKWTNTVTAGNYTWLNYSDFKMWESPAAKAYNVIATPTMFLLDKDKKILDKPETGPEINRVLSGLIKK